MPSTKTPRSKPDYSGVQEVVVSAKRPDRVSRALDKYDDWGKKNPKTKLAADLTPVLGSATSLVDAAVKEDRGDRAGALIDAAGAIPSLKYSRVLGTAIRAMPRVNAAVRGVGAADNVKDVADYVENSKPSKKARGGMITFRGNGIAKRGLTKGRMR
jgi:hypothetical protein